MKYRLLELLCCPDCGGTLHLETFQVNTIGTEIERPSTVKCKISCGMKNCSPSAINAQDCFDCYKQEILEGKLQCEGCANAYPIVNGIPRLLKMDLISECIFNYHPEFLAKYGHQFTFIEPTSATVATKKVQTMHAFSYQWTTFIENYSYYKDIFLSFVTPFLAQKDFENKLVLEVGCGSGRPASIAASFGAEVVAIDLSEAVQSVYSITAHYPMIHVVQGDIYSLPFKPEFDFVYSVGVIQHLPDPASALQSISKVVAPGRKLILWVYGIREFWYQPIEWLRSLTTHLPYKLLHGISLVLAILSELFLLVPYRILSRISLTRNLAECIPGKIYAKFPFRENVVGWFDRLGAPVTHYFTKDDVVNMLSRANFSDIEVVKRPGASASWVAQAVKTSDEGDAGLEKASLNNPDRI